MLLLLLPSVAFDKKPPPLVPSPPLEEVAETLVVRALSSRESYDELAVLCDDIGHRLSGSPALDRAIAWGQERMREDGLVDVHLEPVLVPAWVRGRESLRLVTPGSRDLHMLGLGNSVGTPAGGLDADLLVVGSFDELKARAAEAVGRIVLFDVPFTDYGATVAYRRGGASAAAAVGAVAALVRSVTPASLDTPHTGSLGYDEGVAPIPAAAVTVEVATQLRRLQERGIVPRVHLEMEARFGPDAPSANVVGQVLGRLHPEEVVLLGCHLDSWDVGQGAQDDGAGCAIVLGAVDLLAGLPVPPRRTVRVVLFTNEENGLRGGTAYAEVHAAEAIVAALEVDTGSGQPLGVGLSPPGEDAATASAWQALLRPWMARLAAIGASELSERGGGADIGPLVEARGIPGLSVRQDTSGYWPIHHTEADTFDKIDPVLLARNIAVTAVVAWALADAPALPPPAPTPPAPEHAPRSGARYSVRVARLWKSVETSVRAGTLAAWTLACRGDEEHRSPRVPAETDPTTGWPIREDLDALALAVLDDAHVPGASIALVHGGALVWAAAYGLADTSTGREVTHDSAFMLASVSKTVTATAVMQVRDEGLLDLDADINLGGLPFVVSHPTEPATISTRHLLTHTSGLIDDWGVFGQNYVDGDATISLLDYLEDYFVPGGAWYEPWHYAAWPPGGRYVYANIGVALAGGLVETTTGVPFDDWCDERIFAPLGMHATGWHLADVNLDEAALPHGWVDGAFEVHPHFGYPDYPDGQLRSTAEDLGRFLAAYASGGAPVLAATTVEEMWTEQLTEVVPDQGLVWYYVDFGDRLVGHSGSDYGVATDLWIDAEGNGFVVLLNASPDDAYALNALEYALLQAAQDWSP